MRPERHAFVRLTSAPAVDPCGGTGREVAAWYEAGHGFVVASARPGDAAGSVRLGLATPDKRRIGFVVPSDAIASITPAPGLAEARSHAPNAWAPTIDRLLDLCSKARLHARVFGSLAWTTTSGIDFLRPGSDLDLLLSPCGAETASLAEVVAQLLATTGEGPHLDGELVLSDGSAVHLREFAARPADILLKAHGGAKLVTLQSIDAILEGRALA